MQTIQTWQPTRATGRCMIASWSKWLLRFSFLLWIHNLLEPRRKPDLNPRLSFNLIKIMPTLRSPWSYRCRLRAKAPASGFHASVVFATLNNSSSDYLSSNKANCQYEFSTEVYLGWRFGILLFFFQPCKCGSNRIRPQIWTTWAIFSTDSDLW